MGTLKLRIATEISHCFMVHYLALCGSGVSSSFSDAVARSFMRHASGRGLRGGVVRGRPSRGAAALAEAAALCESLTPMPWPLIASDARRDTVHQPRARIPTSVRFARRSPGAAPQSSAEMICHCSTSNDHELPDRNGDTYGHAAEDARRQANECRRPLAGVPERARGRDAERARTLAPEQTRRTMRSNP